jgi:hypothetical protein
MLWCAMGPTLPYADQHGEDVGQVLPNFDRLFWVVDVYRKKENGMGIRDHPSSLDLPAVTCHKTTKASFMSFRNVRSQDSETPWKAEGTPHYGMMAGIFIILLPCLDPKSCRMISLELK